MNGRNERMDRRRQEGISLIELIIAIVIVGISAAGLASVVVNSLKSPALARQQAQARYLAIERIEEIQDNFRTNKDLSLITVAAFPDEAAVTGFTEYSRTVTVSAIIAGGAGECHVDATNCRDVTVTVAVSGDTRALATFKMVVF